MRRKLPQQSRGSALFSASAVLLAAASAAASDIRFADVTKESGIDLVMTCGRMPAEYILEVDGGGIALFDFDGDGDLDVFLANGARMDDPEHGPGSRLYANDGSGRFVDVTKAVGIEVRRWAMGAAVGDFDGDGWDDLYVSCYGPNVLLRNEGGKRFVDVTERAGVGDSGWGTSAAFGDIDADGDIDLYVVNYLAFDVKHPPSRAGITFQGVNVMAGPKGLVPEQDVLYENLGDGRFRDITKESGCIEPSLGYGLGVRILDLSGDGKPDVFVGNDSTENFYFVNQGGRKFRERGVASGLATNGEGATQATMGIAVGDVDGNGRPDLFSTNFSSDTDTLHANLDGEFFDDQTLRYGLGVVSRPFLGWGCGLYDFDLDGDEDLFISHGHVYPEAAAHAMDTEFAQTLLVYERAGKRFERVMDGGPLCAAKYHGRATAFGDIDQDGDVDVLMTTLNGPVRVFRNDSASGEALVVELSQEGRNGRAIGGVVRLTCGGRHQMRWLCGGGSYQSVDAGAAYFGVQREKKTEPLVVRVSWPDGSTSEYCDVAVDHRIVIEKGAPKPRAHRLRGRAGQ